MTTMNLSLPVDLRTFIEEQARSGGFHSASEYMRDILRQERRRAAQEKLERLLIAGLESGNPVPVTPEYWEKLRDRVAQNAKNRRASRESS